MSSTNQLIDIIKTICNNTANARIDVAVMFGVIKKEKPLEIEVEQRLLLDEDFLVLTSRVTENKINLDHKHKYKDTSDSGEAEKESECAKPEDAKLNIKEIIVNHGLKVNDKVLLLRVQGGNKYVVIDKVV